MEKAPPNLELITRYFADFTAVQVEQFALLGGLYNEWNEKINVISRKDIDNLYEKHILHSLSIAAAFQFRKGMNVIDIGTGGGFPGIPLAIFFPETRFHLIDSIGKKVRVAMAVAEAAGLSNVTTQHGRAEEIRDRKFDVVVSRGVASLKELWTWSKLLLRKRNEKGDAVDKMSEDALPLAKGLICLKGGDLAKEISESGCRPKMMEIFQLFDRDYFKEKYILQVK